MVLFKNVVKLSSQKNIGTSPLGPALVLKKKKDIFLDFCHYFIY